MPGISERKRAGTKQKNKHDRAGQEIKLFKWIWADK